MSIFIRFFLIFSAFLASLLTAPVAAPLAPTFVRVLLCQGKKSLTIECSKGFSVAGEAGYLGERNSGTVSNCGGKVSMGGDLLGEYLWLSPPDGEKIRHGERAYQGRLLVLSEPSGTLKVINYVDPEEYLAGVLAGEVPASWPLESLKAQAVAARSYLYYRLQHPRDPDYDILPSDRDQVYAPQFSQYPSYQKAVQDTKGEVLVVEGQILKAYYHSCCGGSTADGAEVFPADGGALYGRECRFCADAPVFSWARTYWEDELRRLLISGGLHTGRILEVQVVERDRSGRVRELLFKAEEGIFRISGTHLRTILGPRELKSTQFSLTAEDFVEIPLLPRIQEWRWKIRSSGGFSHGFFYTAFGFAGGQAEVPSGSPVKLGDGLLATASSDGICLVGGKPGAGGTFSGSSLSVRAFLKEESAPRVFRIQGRGWGHGVGLCQWGAARMGKEGWNYRQILSFYYNGCQATRISPPPQEASPKEGLR